MEEVANALLVAAEKGIDLRDVLDMDAGGRCERQRSKAAGIAHREFRSDPAAQRLPDQMDAVEIELLEKIEIEVREVSDGIEPRRRIRFAKAGMLRDDHVERLRQPRHERQPGSGTAAAVEKQQRTTGTAAHDADAAIPDRDHRDGMIGHVPPRLAFPHGSAPVCGNYAPRISGTYTLTCRPLDCDGRQASRIRDLVEAKFPVRRKEEPMYAPAGVKTSTDYPIPDTMKAWVLGDPGQLSLTDKPVPVPKKAEVLVRIDAVAICATDLEIIYHGPPASILGGMPHNKNFTPGHEYMGTVVALGPGVDEYRIGQRVTVEIHAGCGQCKRCREGMYTACHNYGLNYGDVDKGHRANGFTTDGGFCEYQVNNINTLVAIPDEMSDEEATLVVTAGTAMYGLTELGGLVAGESVVVTGPGPIGLLGVAVAKAMGAHPVILTGTRDNRLKIGLELGADHVVNVRKEDAVEAVRRLNGGKGVDYVVECSGAPNAVNEAIRMVNRGGKVCLAAFPHEETPVDVAHIVRNNIYVYGIRGEGKSATHRAEAFMTQKRFDATKIHTHTFPLADLPTAIRYAKDRVEDAIKVVVKARGVSAAHKVAAE